MSSKLTVPQQNPDRQIGRTEDSFRTIAAAVPGMVWVCKPTGENIFLNERWHEFTGQDPEESSEYGWTKAAHPEDWERLAPKWKQCQETGEVYEGEIRYMRHDGEYRWFDFRAFPSRNKEGIIQAWYGISIESHEKKLAGELLEHKIHSRTRALVESNYLLQAVFDATTNAFSILEPVRNDNGDIEDFRHKFVNRSFVELYPGSEMAGELYSAIFKSFKQSRLFENLKKVVDSGQPARLILKFEENKEARWLSTVTVKLGEGILLSIEDITELTKSEAKLRENAHFTSQIIETTADIIYILDLNTLDVVFANRKVASDLGYTDERIAGMSNPIFDIMHPDDVQPMLDHLQQIKQLRTDDRTLEIEYRLINAKGGLNWFTDRNTVFRRDENNIPIQKLGICIEITQRKLREEEDLTKLNILHQSEDLAVIGSWHYDIQTGEMKWSDGLYKLFNLERGRPVSPYLYKQFTPPEQATLVDQIVGKITTGSGDFEEMISLIPRHSQERKIIRMKAVVLRDKKDRPVTVIGVDMDITQQVATATLIHDLNEDLREKNRSLNVLNTELKTFHKVTSNDYKETLQVLYTNLEYIATKEARNLSDTSRANIRRAQVAIQRMNLLTDDINSYLRLFDLSVQKQSLDIGKVLQLVFKKFRGKIEEADISVINENELPVKADEALFTELLSRIVDNSLKFRMPGEKLVITIESHKLDIADRDFGRQTGTYKLVSVKDNGIGIPDAEKRNVFELFYRLHDKTKFKGSGIGLAICKKIMLMHDGFIEAEPVVQGGTEINCYFPEWI